MYEYDYSQNGERIEQVKDVRYLKVLTIVILIHIL